ncbi:MFS transporter permease [Burkholderia sp. Leaf177]|uniref:MFS transporter n=1 Tax=Burkholderia sp. Leaf177 TaxID=1736287 RepID=UPI0006F1DD88|nr:MFS transporter [Burkholderia sp. Leaf177]KQR78694.1 MFS transporter permease [Burkholderia sp. Leaf177]
MSTPITDTARGTLHTDAQAERELYRKLTWRLIPFFCLCYFSAYLDRVNVGLAKLQMLDALHFSDTVYGLGAGLFFVGYILFEVPSNLILQKVGAKLWIARIMITWGILSGLTMFVKTPGQFYVLRFMLGVAEAGFLPGVLLYLTNWFPDARRSKIIALFMMGLPLSSLIGGPLSGWILTFFDGIHGWQGWQWLFGLEALPSIVLGVLVFFYLPNTVESARFLDHDERRRLKHDLAQESHAGKSHRLRDAFTDPKVWALGLIDLCVLLGTYAISFWLPSIIRDSGVKSALEIGMLTTIPNALAVVMMLVTGASSDKYRERRWHIVVPFACTAFGLIASTFFSGSTAITVILLSIANAGVAAAMPVVWALPSTFLRGTAAAAGIAFACSIANLGGFASTYVLGWMKDATHSMSAGLITFGILMLAGCLLALAMPKSIVNR